MKRRRHSEDNARVVLEMLNDLWRVGGIIVGVWIAQWLMGG